MLVDSRLGRSASLLGAMILGRVFLPVPLIGVLPGPDALGGTMRLGTPSPNQALSDGRIGLGTTVLGKLKLGTVVLPTVQALGFQASGSGTAKWIGTSRPDAAFQCDGSATVSWSQGPKEGKFECDGSGTAVWTAYVIPQLGSFECDGSATVQWIAGLSAVHASCVVGSGGSFPPPTNNLKNVSHSY